jgi:hypothetical protein
MASAALSLVCNQCGAQLKNMKEAQSHADATGHADFAESTEAVLQLVCRYDLTTNNHECLGSF